ncbi:MAG TPA: creatininase family protein [Haliangiales bacterium]|nr:creatininase family protein [Haliangiales bacterium]
MRLADATWTEVRDLLARDPVALVPVGAVEAHGPHLPLATDVIIAEGICRRATAALARPAAVAPAVAYAVAEYAAAFSGTVCLPAAAAAEHLQGIVDGLRRTGFARVCLVNAHLEPAHVQVLRGVRGAAFADCLEKRFARTLTEEFKRGACHAGRYETSLVLAERPDLVRGLRAGLPPLPIDLAAAMRRGVRTFEEAGAADAYFGDPAAASAEEGEQIYARLVDMVATVVAEAWPT